MIRNVYKCLNMIFKNDMNSHELDLKDDFRMVKFHFFLILVFIFGNYIKFAADSEVLTINADIFVI